MCKKFWWNKLLRCGVPINGHVHGKISLIFSAGHELEWRSRFLRSSFKAIRTSGNSEMELQFVALIEF